jgi:hypothetical protein
MSSDSAINNNNFLGLPGSRSLNGFTLEEGANDLGVIDIDISGIEDAILSNENIVDLGSITSPAIVRGTLVNVKSVNKKANSLQVELFHVSTPSVILARTSLSDQGKFKVTLDLDDFSSSEEQLRNSLGISLYYNGEEIPLFTLPLFNSGTSTLEMFIEADLLGIEVENYDNIRLSGTIDTGIQTIGCSELIVRFFSVGINQEILIGSSLVHNDFSFSTDVFIPERSVIIQTRAYLLDGSEAGQAALQTISGIQIRNSNDPIRVDTKFNLILNEGIELSPDEYTRYNILLTRMFGSLDEIFPSESNTAFIQQKSGIALTCIQCLLATTQTYTEDEIDPIVLYGLLRTGMPIDASKLKNTDAIEVNQRLLTAIEKGIIDEDDVTTENTEDAVDAILNQLNQGLLDSSPFVTGATFEEIIDVASVLDPEQKKQFAQAYNSQINYNDLWSNILTLIPGITEPEAEELRFTFQVAGLSLGAPEFIEGFKDLYGTTLSAGTIALSAWNQADFETFIQDIIDDNSGHDVFPKVVPGSNIAAKKTAFARSLTRIIEHSFPTQSLVSRLSETPSDFSTKLASFTSSNSDFVIGADSVNKYLTDNPGALSGITDPEEFTQNLVSLQARYLLSPGFERHTSIKALEDIGISSSLDVMQMSWSEFSQQYTNAGGSDQVAGATYEMAARNMAVMQEFQQKYKTDLNTPLSAVSIPALLEYINDELASDPNLKTLFGSQDYCECSHCRSIFGPSAYIVDVFQFLSKVPSSVGSGTNCWEVLESRRPDLCHLLLNCENANTPLPYVDILNEILENGIAKILEETPDYTYQTTSNSRELIAFPEHMRTSVYATEGPLINAIYPWTLPFDMWSETGSTYLAQLKINRSSLMESFFAGGESSLFNDPSISDEIIGLRGRDRIILKGGMAEGWYSDHSLWGFSSSTPFVTELRQVNKLLDRSDISFEELQQLLKTYYINPTGELQIVFDVVDSCDLDQAKLQYKSSSDVYTDLTESGTSHSISDHELFMRIARFYRLKSRLGWSIRDLDIVIKAFGENEEDVFSDELLAQIAIVVRLNKTLKKPLIQIASVFGDIYTGHLNDLISDRSLYATSFQNKSVANPSDVAFDLDSSLQELVNDEEELIDHLPNIRQALGIPMDDLMLLIEELSLDDEHLLTLSNLSFLYRHAFFAKALKMSVNELLTQSKLSGISPFSTTDTWNCISFIEYINNLKSAKIKLPHLKYLQYARQEVNEGVAYKSSDLKLKLIELKDGLDEIIATNIAIEDPLNIFLKTKLALAFNNQQDIDAILDSIETSNYDVMLRPIFGTSESDPLTWISLDEELIDSSLRSSFLLDKLLAFLTLIQIDKLLLQFVTDTFKILPESALLILNYPAALTIESVAYTIAEVLKNLDNYQVDEIGELEDESESILAFSKLHKLSLIISLLKLSSEEFRFILKGSLGAAWLGWIDPELIQSSSNDLENTDQYEGLSLTLEKLYPFLTWSRKFKNADLSIYSIIEAAFLSETFVAETFYQNLSLTTGWDKNQIGNLFTYLEYTTSDVYTEELYLKMDKCFKLIKLTGSNVEQIIDDVDGWILPTLTYDAATSIIQGVRSVNQEKSWPETAKAIRDILREKQREALSTYLVINQEGINSRDDLYNFYLVDSEMGACTMTSRTRLAMSSAQLFVQRCLMNLEDDVDVRQEDYEHWNQWKWMKRYRVWEANRKVFTYPENWIEPELRDDKTEFFKDLEAELAQVDINDETVSKAYLNYLKKLEGVSNMDILGICSADDDADDYSNGYYVFGRRNGKPANIYFRKFTSNKTWTNWQKIENDFEGNHLIPIVFNKKLMMFWPMIIFRKTGGTGLPDESPPVTAHIQMAWSEFSNGSWSARRISESKLVEKANNFSNYDQTDESGTSRYFFTKLIYPNNPTELIFRAIRRKWGFRENPVPGPGVIWTEFHEIGYFTFDVSQNVSVFDTTNEATVINLDALGTRAVSNQQHFNIKTLPYPETDELEINGVRFLNIVPNAPKEYKVTFVNDDWRESDDRNVLEKPFVFKDSMRTYYVRRDVNDHFVFENLYHPYVKDFIRAINIGGVESLLNPSSQESDSKVRALRRQQVFIDDFVETYSPNTSIISEIQPIQSIDFSSNGSYSAYNWELFFHIPMYIAGKLSQNQKFEEATKWYQYVFDPTDASAEYPSPQRFWKIKPFMEVYSTTEDIPSSIYELMAILANGGAGSSQITQQVEEWRNNPFNPHLIARSRLFAYQKNVVMKYIDNLIAWADMLFTQDTIESTGEATQLYMLASHILGEKPRKINGKTPEDMTYCQLVEEGLDEFSNAMIELETRLTLLLYRPYDYGHDRVSKSLQNPDLNYLNQFSKGQGIYADGLGFDDPSNVVQAPDDRKYLVNSSQAGKFQQGMSWENGLLNTHNTGRFDRQYVSQIVRSLYFCVPSNEKLNGYWDLVGDRLFKLRHCMDIEGRFRQLPLFDPPIDPALLVRATAGGIDINSVIANLYAPLPNYRFAYTLAKAKEFAGIVKGLGQTLLSALEKRDGETLALLRSTHEIDMLDTMTAIKKLQVSETQINIRSLENNKQMAQNKSEYYGGRENLNTSEQSQLSMMQAGIILQGISSTIKTTGAALAPITKVTTYTTYPGVLTEVVDGGKLMRTLSTVADALSITSSGLYQQASISGIRGSYTRRKEDWDFQKKLADEELKMIEKQILAAELRSEVSNADLENHKLGIEQKEAEQDFMQSKFSNEQLYNWMITQLSVTYFQSYQLAYKLALQAERCYRYELSDSNDSFVSFGYWDSLKKGLLSAEKLEFDLLRMETSYMEKNKRMFELTKQVSLLMWNPIEILKLREKGKCSISLMEEMFDLDHPGHYLRRIKSVSISIPCVTGPYTGVTGKLTLGNNYIRKSPIADVTGVDYAMSLDSEGDSRFLQNLAAIQSIATSTGQNDSGMFNLNFNDERYLPFEGAGVISEWEFELPDTYRNFDYDTISDVIITINYMAKDGGETLKSAAVANLGNYMEVLSDAEPAEEQPISMSRLFSMKHEFGNEWHSFLHGADPEALSTAIVLKKKLFPFYLKSKSIAVSAVNVYAQVNDAEAGLKLDVSSSTPNTPALLGAAFVDLIRFKSFESVTGSLVEDSDAITLTLTNGDGGSWDELCRDLFIEVIYSAS